MGEVLPEPIKPIKPGWKSTEFWFTIAVLILGAIQSVGLVGEGTTWDKLIGAGLMVLAGLGYTASRTLIKK